ncbi:Uncharacterized protein BM_BM10615 [Brugia malayi]|uniref:Bm10615 n=1 Tax=Brugia malayi TaxID=6279 RepID=A0A1U7F1Q7_BRUMA|nr:Uncharacterized protein BM_BM10615 [Brugia malayi]CDP98910.1 Bm10615 [Brugia malayi]VIO98112.1 Uncharacterized protein BM_BM10615 [Brugia malayi]
MAGIIIQLSPAISRGFRGKRGTREVLMMESLLKAIKDSDAIKNEDSETSGNGDSKVFKNT